MYNKTLYMEQKNLSVEEIDFCDLYVNGGFGVSGDSYVCYEEAFGVDNKRNARLLMSRPEIKAKIKELIDDFVDNEDNRAIAMKIQITDTLQKVMKETSTDVYYTPRGEALSPAPLRAVAVNSAKALADMYVKKQTQSHDLKVGDGNGGIIFNVVVPQTALPDETSDKK